MTCATCHKPKENWPDDPKWPLKGRPTPLKVEYALCSVECYKEWIKGRSLFLTLRLLRHLDGWSFDKFQEVFHFSEAGDYALEKYRQMRTSPFYFLCRMDKHTLQKLAKAMEF